eukprot:523613_1
MPQMEKADSGELNIDVDSSSSSSSSNLSSSNNNEDTNEISQQSYDVGAPPTRHHRQDTLHLHHKKRGTLTDIDAFSASASPLPDNENTKYKIDINYENIQNIQNINHNNINDDNIIDDNPDNEISDMETPHPADNVISTTPTMFNFDEDQDNQNNFNVL